MPLLVPASLLAPGVGQVVRGESEQAKPMLLTAASAFGAGLVGAFLMASTGAADVTTAAGVPIAMAGISGFATLGLTDAVGTFSRDVSLAEPLVQGDGWNAGTRVGAGVVLADRVGSADRPNVRVFGAQRWERWLLQGELGLSPGTVDGAGELLVGRRLIGYSAAAPRAGLWLEGSARHERLGRLGFDATRGRVQLVSTLPMGVFAPRFGRVTSQVRLGVDPTWVRFRGSREVDVEVPFSGGFELRVAAAEQLRLFGGYEHARDGLVGGAGTGFFGPFFAGAELGPFAGLVLEARLLAGTPMGGAVSLEWRR